MRVYWIFALVALAALVSVMSWACTRDTEMATKSDVAELKALIIELRINIPITEPKMVVFDDPNELVSCGPQGEKLCKMSCPWSERGMSTSLCVLTEVDKILPEVIEESQENQG